MTAHIATVKRHYKHEAEQEIRDLEARGYVVTHPLTEEKRNGKSFKSDNYSRKIFVEHTISSKWIAQLKRVVE